MHISRILCRPKGRNDIDVISVGMVVLYDSENECDFLISGDKLSLLKHFISEENLTSFESILSNHRSSKDEMDLEELTNLSKKQKGLLGFTRPKVIDSSHIELSKKDIISNLFQNWIDYNKDIGFIKGKSLPLDSGIKKHIKKESRLLSFTELQILNW